MAFLRSTIRAIAIPGLWFLLIINTVSLIQWTCVQFLMLNCHKSGLMGLVHNLLSLGSPVCITVNQIQVALAIHYVQLWTVVGTICTGWFINRLSLSK